MGIDTSTSFQDEMLRSSLANLAAYTERGNELAWHSVELLDDVAKSAATEIGNTIEWLESCGMDDAQVRNHLTSQLDTISRDFGELPYEIAEKLNALPDETFTVSLFGRTKVGKSTLVSILTKGDGSIIGNGSQRTTREARAFPWEGLNVIDVPGVSATGEGGEQDARVALEAAQPSDLIVFIVASDSLQNETAGYLARVRALGKPVICLANIKAGRRIRDGHEQEDIETLCRYIDYAFADEKKLQAIREAVLAYDDEFSQQWGPMPFAYAHLKSAFLSRHKQYEPWEARLREASRFDSAIAQIADEIGRRGCFMRLQSYIDTVTGPLIEAYEGLSRQSFDSLTQLQMLSRRIEQYEKWVDDFTSSCEMRTKTLVTEINDELKAEADIFAERHFKDKRANEHWSGIVRNARSESRANKLLSEFEAEATERLRSLGREISIDLKFLQMRLERGTVKPQAFVDKKRIWNRAMTATEVVLGAAFFATNAPVLATAGVAAGGAHLVGDLLLKDGKRKKEDAIREFRRRLGENITSHGNWLHKQVMDEVGTEIVSGQLADFGSAMRSLYEGVASLGTAQLALSAQLCDQIEDLNRSLVQEALNYDGQGHHASDIVGVARIPGDLALIVTKPHTFLPPEILDSLSVLLGEVVTIEAGEDGRVPLSTLVPEYLDGGVLAAFAGDKYVMTYAPDVHGEQLRRIRASMQLISMLDIR